MTDTLKERAEAAHIAIGEAVPAVMRGDAVTYWAVRHAIEQALRVARDEALEEAAAHKRHVQAAVELFVSATVDSTGKTTVIQVPTNKYDAYLRAACVLRPSAPAKEVDSEQ